MSEGVGGCGGQLRGPWRPKLHHVDPAQACRDGIEAVRARRRTDDQADGHCTRPGIQCRTVRWERATSWCCSRGRETFKQLVSEREGAGRRSTSDRCSGGTPGRNGSAKSALRRMMTRRRANVCRTRFDPGKQAGRGGHRQLGQAREIASGQRSAVCADGMPHGTRCLMGGGPGDSLSWVTRTLVSDVHMDMSHHVTARTCKEQARHTHDTPRTGATRTRNEPIIAPAASAFACRCPCRSFGTD